MLNTVQTTSNISPTNQAGVYNEFVAPIVDSGAGKKKDIVKNFLIWALVISILLAGGLFLYLKMLSSQINNYKNQLASYDSTPALQSFEQNLPQMRDLSQRLKLLNFVYDGRVYVSGLMLPILESAVESKRDSYVYFNRFSIKKEGNSNLSLVNISGVAIDYPSLIRQLNTFKSDVYKDYISNFKLTSFSLDPVGNITFDLSFNVNVSTEYYLKYINNNLNNYMNASSSARSGPLFRNSPPVEIPVATSSTSTASTTDSHTNNSTTSIPSVHRIEVVQ